MEKVKKISIFFVNINEKAHIKNVVNAEKLSWLMKDILDGIKPIIDGKANVKNVYLNQKIIGIV